jgi:cell division protein FtsL
MNAIAKAMIQNLSFERQFTPVKLSSANLRIWLLVVAIMVSALAVVYVKDLNRRLYIDYQSLQQINSETNVDYSKLLLEQGAWSTQGRVQVVAMNSLNMIIPPSSNIVMLKL